jgi:hypothetical protein
MIESAIAQLVFREPRYWAEMARDFANDNGLTRLSSVLSERERAIDGKQMEITDVGSEEFRAS